MARTVILMAYRGDGEGYGGSGWRDRAFTYVWDYLTQFTEDIVVHDSGDEPFSISKSYNQASEQAGDWDKAIIHPPDVYVPWPQLEEGVARADKQLVRPYKRLRQIKTPADQEAFFKGEHPQSGKRYPGAFPPLIVPRHLWDQIGGFDTRLVGHSAEDSIFLHCAKVFGGGFIKLPGLMYALYHPKPPEDPFYQHKDRNQALLAELRAITDPDELRSFLDR